MLEWFQHKAAEVAEAYEDREFGHAMRTVMHLADVANKYIAEKAPWEMAKDPARASELHEVCSIALNLFRQLTIMLKPVTPALAAQVERFLRIEPLAWRDLDTVLPTGHEIGVYEHLMQRVDPKQLGALFDTGEPETELNGLNGRVAGALQRRERAVRDQRLDLGVLRRRTDHGHRAHRAAPGANVFHTRLRQGEIQRGFGVQGFVVSQGGELAPALPMGTEIPGDHTVAMAGEERMEVLRAAAPIPMRDQRTLSLSPFQLNQIKNALPNKFCSGTNPQ